ncbi:TauD/TfdA family dioxygenase [Orrella marina]|uniref:Uncharacterized protein n=1 Tax=Orrella marina TaxID=2163011 RepID=A0A2R4XL67_9BURK|nr:TauD/TfdA family dioxygenase [Orrella marina]AWB34511.1 hypothetical protein DBV39_13215 [Orrella marina]
MNTRKYPLAGRILHWIVAILVLGLASTGLWMVSRAGADLWDDLTNSLYAWHKAMGFAVLLLMLIRVLVKLFCAQPGPVASLSPATRKIAASVHGLLYLLLLVIPLMGWAGVTAFPALGINANLSLPAMPGISTDQALAKQFFEIHSTLAFVLIGLTALHIAAALRHWLINKDEVLDRMLFCQASCSRQRHKGDIPMTATLTRLTFTPLHRSFMAEVSPVDLRTVTDEETLGTIRQAMNQYGVLVFHDQKFENQEQVEFAKRLDGKLHEKTSSRVLAKNRYGNEALTDISNVSAEGDILGTQDRRRMNGICNRIWHTDASFEEPAGRYSMLFARNIPPVRADTEFADMRAAYDALDEQTKEAIQDLHAYHSIVYSRHVMGFDFSPEEAAQLPGATHPLVRRFDDGRRALYLASHAERIIELDVPSGRLLLRDLIEHATRPEFLNSHEWAKGDLVIWDNRMTMHRARPFDDVKYKRELTRVTTLDLARNAA